MFVNSDFSDLLHIFNDHAVKYLVIGGYAALIIGQLLGYWEETGKVEKDKIEETRKFLGKAI